MQILGKGKDEYTKKETAKFQVCNIIQNKVLGF